MHDCSQLRLWHGDRSQQPTCTHQHLVATSTACPLQMLDYNVPGGKLNRGMAVLDVLRALKGDQVSRSVDSSHDVQVPPMQDQALGAELFISVEAMHLHTAQEISAEEAQGANILGWCIEWVSGLH